MTNLLQCAYKIIFNNPPKNELTPYKHYRKLASYKPIKFSENKKAYNFHNCYKMIDFKRPDIINIFTILQVLTEILNTRSVTVKPKNQ